MIRRILAWPFLALSWVLLCLGGLLFALAELIEHPASFNPEKGLEQ